MARFVSEKSSMSVVSSFEGASTQKQSSDDGKEATPVPIPNTEVKLFCADGSWGSPPVRVGRRWAILCFIVVPRFFCLASIAQQVECFHGKEEVTGSNPVGSLYF